MLATVKPRFLTLLRWRQRSCQGWSCRVTSPQQEVVCIGDYHFICFVGFQACPVGNVRSCPALVPWRSQTVHIHMPCTWTIMNPGIYASSFRYYDVDFHIDEPKAIINNRSTSIHCTVAWPWCKRSTITKEAVQRFQASVRARMSGWGLDVFCAVRFWCNAKLGSFHPSQMLKTFLYGTPLRLCEYTLLTNVKNGMRSLKDLWGHHVVLSRASSSNSWRQFAKSHTVIRAIWYTITLLNSNSIRPLSNSS